MKDLLQNVLMTAGLFPVSMVLVWLFMKLSGPIDKKLYWYIVVAGYLVMLFICWGVETGLLYQMIR